MDTAQKIRLIRMIEKIEKNCNNKHRKTEMVVDEK